MPPRSTSQGSAADLVAVFIDLENLALGAGESMPGQADPIPYKALELLCRDYGNTSIRRAYADWSRPEFAKHQHNLAQNGITLIQVTRFGAQQKNAADILMAVDAMEVLITHPDVGTFMLVAGGGTKASASARLVAVCSEYKYWGTIVAAVNPEVRAEVGAKFDIADAERLVVEAMEESPDATATGSWLKSKMMALDPAFDERNYGSKSFRALLSRLPNLVEVKKDRSSPDMRVTLIAPRQGASPDAVGQPEPAAAGAAGGRRAEAPAGARRS